MPLFCTIVQSLQHLHAGEVHYRASMGRRRATSKPKTPLAERLNYVMEEMGWSAADLAREVEASEQSTVGNWLSGRNKSMAPAFAYRLQDKHYWNARWLMEGTEGLPRRLPVLEPERKQVLEHFTALPLERLRAVMAAFDIGR